MAMSPSASKGVARVFRIVARTLSALILAFAVVMFIGYTRAGEGPFNQRADQPGANQAEQDTRGEAIGLTLVLVALAGLVVGWRWERLGGALLLFVALVVAVATIMTGDTNQVPLTLLILTVPGGSFVLASLFTRYANRSAGPSPPAEAGTPTPPRPVGPIT